MILPDVTNAIKLEPDVTRLFIGAFGFEDRSLGWVNYQKDQGPVLSDALLFKYNRPKGTNRAIELQRAITELGVPNPNEVNYDYGARFPGIIEESIDVEFKKKLSIVDEVILNLLRDKENANTASSKSKQTSQRVCKRQRSRSQSHIVD
jgi:hypothetical protein